MDVHRPETPNGLGVKYVSGSGWQAPLGYEAAGLKDDARAATWTSPLLRAGYTVFAINYRAAPRFHYPAAIEDVQRAIRYVRHHATEFGIEARQLGGVGGSSGAHLIALAAMLAAAGLPEDPDPVNRKPATLQAIVIRAAPTDLTRMRGGNAAMPMAVFMNAIPPGREAPAAAPVTAASNSKMFVCGVTARARRRVVTTGAAAPWRCGYRGAVPAVRGDGSRAAGGECPDEIGAPAGRRPWLHVPNRRKAERKSA